MTVDKFDLALQIVAMTTQQDPIDCQRKLGIDGLFQPVDKLAIGITTGDLAKCMWIQGVPAQSNQIDTCLLECADMAGQQATVGCQRYLTA